MTFTVLTALAAASVAAIGLGTAPTNALDLTVDEARTIVAPFYELISNTATNDVAAVLASLTTPDFRSFSSNDAAATIAEVAPGLAGLGQIVPDLKWEIKDVLVDGNKVIVRGEASGTPIAPFFGVPPSGKSFRIMSIDIHTVENGKVASIYHLEDWAGALGQLAPTPAP